MSAELATAAEKQDRAWTRVERDETSPSMANLLAICDALGLPVAGSVPS